MSAESDVCNYLADFEKKMLRSGVLNPRESAKIIAELSEHVSIRSEGIAKLAKQIISQIDDGTLSTNYFLQNEVHPRATDEWAADWIFLVDSLNFCFWSVEHEHGTPDSCVRGWTVSYKGKNYTGYFALCAAVNKAKDDGLDITNPAVYTTLTENQLAEIVKGLPKTAPLGLIKERVQNLKEVGTVLMEKYGGTFKNVIKASNGSAVKLLRLIVEDFPCFRDEAVYKGHNVSFYKRAQIVVGDIWTCFEGKGLGAFDDIDAMTMFPDYRVPQSLIFFGVLKYTEDLMNKLQKGELLESGSEEEVEIRGCSVHAVELLSSQVQEEFKKKGKQQPLNSILLDHFLWEFRRKKSQQIKKQNIPFHKTVCIFY